MLDPTGEAKSEALRLDFDRRLVLQFRGSVITSDGGLLAYRELDDVLALTTSGGERLAEARTGKNRQHLLVGLLRQSVFGRLAGYEDVNDAERLCHDPAMRWVVGDRAITGAAASASQMGRFETQWLTRPENLAALTDLPGTTMVEVRLDDGKPPSSGPARSSISPFWLVTGAAAIEFRCGAPRRDGQSRPTDQEPGGCRVKSLNRAREQVPSWGHWFA
jgi:hypothetical protein